MKIKKMLTILLTSMLLLTSSTSVLASESSKTSPGKTSIVTPTMIGVGDTKAQAVQVSSGAFYASYLVSNTDQDWYSWTNNTGSFKYIGAFYSPQGFDSAYRMGMEIDYTANRFLSRIYANNSGNPRNSSSIVNVLIPPGATVYFVIDPVETTIPQTVYYFQLFVYNF